MSDFDYDLFVIGAGSGGVRAARISAGHGARVAICEESRLGGTCVIRGCVPKKLFTYAAHFSEDFEDAAGYGWNVGATEFSWPGLIRDSGSPSHLVTPSSSSKGSAGIWSRTGMKPSTS